MIGEETVVRIQTDVGTAFHGFRQNVRPQLARQGSRNGFVEEEPNVPAFARPRSLQGCRQVHLAASFQKRGDIVLPRCFVKIGGQEETGFIQKHWIDAHDEIAAMVVLTPQMPPNRIVSYGKKTLVGAFGTFDSGLFADSLDPFIAAHWRIAGPARLAAFEAARVNIFASTKQGTEEGDFGLGGGMLIHATLRQVRQSDRCVHNPILHSHLPQSSKHNRKPAKSQLRPFQASSIL